MQNRPKGRIIHLLVCAGTLLSCATGELRDGEADRAPARDAATDAPARPDASTDRDVAIDALPDDGGLDDADGDGDDDASSDTPRSDASPDTGDADCSPGTPDCDPIAPPGACCEQQCTEGTCITVAGVCGDRCELQQLRTSGTCTGCGAPDAAGACDFAVVLPCDSDNANLCAEASCGGQTWFCTETDGVWGWRTSAACDDGQACTSTERCSEGVCGGPAYSCEPEPCPDDRCEGTTWFDSPASCDRACDGLGGCVPCECVERPKPCGTGPDNECCEATCDAALGCGTTAGSCGADVCSDPNRLLRAGSCAGCGAENASGTCSAPVELRCDATIHTPCQQSTCGGATYTCSNVGGVWQWRATGACDDGNPCTWGDTCSGGLCQGTAVVCADTDCMDRECNGTASCAETPRTGSPCNDGNVCTATDVCTAAGVCAGSGSGAVCGDGTCNCGENNGSCAADCPIVLPANACANGSQSRDGCGNARIIGRSAAAAGWTSGEQNTCASSARNRHEGECSVFDVGPDHTYAIYLLAGERATVTLGVGTRECASGEYFNSRLKFRFHANNTSGGATTCPTAAGCWAGPRAGETRIDTRTYDAPSDGWLFVVVDGGATAHNEHRGYYTLGLTLSRCSAAGCGCL